MDPMGPSKDGSIKRHEILKGENRFWVHQKTWGGEKLAKFGRVHQKTWVPFFEPFISDSLTTILVEPHWCHLHQFILLTQWNFGENILRIGGFEKRSFFKLTVLDFYASSPWKWMEILMITLVSSPKQHLPKHMQHSIWLGHDFSKRGKNCRLKITSFALKECKSFTDFLLPTIRQYPLPIKKCIFYGRNNFQEVEF